MDTFVLFQADNTDESYTNVTVTAKNMSIGTIGTDLIVSSDKIAYYNKLLVIYYSKDNSLLTVPEVVLGENINTKAFETLTASTKTEKNDQNKDETIVTLGNGSEFTFENKVISNAIGKLKLSNGKNIKFTNCVFINPSLQIYAYSFSTDTNIEFENCKFIGNTGVNSNGAVMIDGNHHIKASFKGCTFTNTRRAINTQFRQSSTLDSSVTIEDCIFNGVTDEKYAALQVTNDSTVVTFKNNTINGLGNAACIVRFHENWTTYTDTTLSNVTFEGNTVNSSIVKAKYIDLDGKETAQDAFYKAALAKFKTGLKTK